MSEWEPSAVLEELRAERDRLRDLKDRGMLDTPEKQATWREAQARFLLANADEVVAHHQERVRKASR